MATIMCAAGVIQYTQHHGKVYVQHWQAGDKKSQVVMYMFLNA